MSWLPTIGWGAGGSSSSNPNYDVPTYPDDDNPSNDIASYTVTDQSSSSTTSDSATQHLRKEKGIVGQVFTRVTGVVKQGAGKAVSVLGGGAGHALTPVAEAVLKDLANKAVQKSHPCLDILVTELPIFQKRPLIYPTEKKAVLIENLKLFKEHFHDIVLKGTMESDQKTPARPDNAQYQQICALLDALETNKDVASLIEPVKNTLSHFQKLQKGYLQHGTDWLKTHGVDHAKAFLGLNKTSFVNEASIKKAQDHDRIIQQMAVREEPRDNEIPSEHNERVMRILTQIQEFSVLAQKAILVRLIFPNDPYMLPTVLETAKGQHARDPDIDLNTQAFYEALMIKFDEKPRSVFDRFFFRFHLTVTASIIGFYVKHISFQFRSDLHNFLLKNSHDRLDDIFSLVINPFKGHLTTFYSQLEKLSKSDQVLEKNIEEIIEDLFKQFKVDGKSHTDLMNKLAVLLVNKYAPTFSWTNSFRTILDKRLPPNNPVFDMTKKILVGATTITTGPFQWIINVTIKRTIQWVVNRFVLPSVLQSTQTALGVGSHYQHVFNLFLEKKLTAFNAGMSENRSKLIRAIQSPLARQLQMKGVMDQVLKAIPLQTAMNDPESLNQYFNPGLTIDGLNKVIDDAIRKAISTDAALEVLKVLEQSLEPELLSEFVWYTFKNLLKNMAEKQIPATLEIMRLTEQKMINQLREALRSAVEEAVEAALHPAKKLNDETIIDIENLRKTAVEFVKSCKEVNENSFKQHDDAWIELIGLVTKLMDKWERTKVPSLVELNRIVGESFTTATSHFSELMKKLQPLQQSRNSLQKTVEELKIKQTYFKTNHLTTIQINAGAQSLYALAVEHPNLSALQTPLTQFLTYTKVYMGLRKIDKSSQDIFIGRFQEIKKLLDEVVQSLEKEITKASEEMNNNTKILGEQLDGLEAWAQSLTPAEVTSEEVPSTLQWIGEKVGDPVQDYLVKRLMEYVNAILAMKSKSYHWNGVMWRIVDAYLRSPPQKQIPLPNAPPSSSQVL